MSAPVRKTAPRCCYCRRDASAWFSFKSYLSARRRPWGVVTVGACYEHEGCVNWNSQRALHPDSPVQRAKVYP